MDDNQITHVLNLLGQYRRCFTLEELSNFADSDSDNEILSHALLTDSRFMQLEEAGYEEKHTMPKRSLFQWFCQLSLKLAQAKQARLSKHQVAMLMSSLRMDGRWDTPPMEAVQFGSHFGFIGPAWTTNQYVFPVAHILSFTESPAGVASIVMEKSPEGEETHLAFEELARQLNHDAFSRFSEKVRYVVQAREGLLTSRRMTLEQVGTQLGGFTREWARQVEARFWTKLRARPRGRLVTTLFSTALVCNVISKQGSLVVRRNSPEAFLLSFLAKCAGVPQAVLPDTEILVFGTSQKDLLPSQSDSSTHEETDIDSIATWLESGMHLCLTHTDLRILADSIGQFRQKLLTKPLIKGQRAYLALRAIGSPAHCSEITEVYNSLFPDQPSTEHNLHAVLSREQYGVVWIGIRSTFALKEWGYEHPSKSLFDSVTEIVEERYKETAQPVPFGVIVAEMGKSRQIVNPSSLTIAAHCNPSLRRVGKESFVPKEPTEEIREEVSAEELDRILREFEKDSDERPTDQEVSSTSGKTSPLSPFRHALVNLKKKLTSSHP